jgi:hypothetical protein
MGQNLARKQKDNMEEAKITLILAENQAIKARCPLKFG